MFLELALTAMAYRFVRYRMSQTARGTRATGLFTSPSDALGAEGEALAHAKLKETLEWLCGSNYYLNKSPLVIEYAPGSEFPTAEIDHVAVTAFGIFVIETKHWSGRIAPSTDPNVLIRTPRSGRAEERRSPLAQNRTKVAFLRSRLPRSWEVTDAGLFTSPGVRLDPGLDSNLVTLADLPQWLRFRRDAHAGKPSIDVAKAVQAIALYADGSLRSINKHKARCKSHLLPNPFAY